MFCVLLNLSGCSGKQEIDPYLRSLGLDYIEKELIEVADLNQFGVLMVNEFAVYEDDWIAFRGQRDQYFVSLLNIRTGQEIPLLRKGRGPGEFSSPIGFDAKPQSLLVSDSSSHTIVSVDIPESIAAGCAVLDTVLQWKDVPYMVRPHYLSSGFFVTSGINPNNPEWFTLRDGNGQMLSGVPAPFSDDIKSMDMSALASFVGSTIFTSETTGDRFCAAMVSAAALSFSVTENGLLQEICRIEAIPPRTVTINSGGKIQKTSKRYFASICSDKRGVYLLYSGELLGQTPYSEEAKYMVMYDWDGCPRSYYKLSTYVRYMTVWDGHVFFVTNNPTTKLLTIK